MLTDSVKGLPVGLAEQMGVPPPEQDPGFPSGKWVGFYTYNGGVRYRMDMHLTFSEGRLTGEGIDGIRAIHHERVLLV